MSVPAAAGERPVAGERLHKGLARAGFGARRARVEGWIGPRRVALAIENGCDAADIGLTIHPHPTLSETVAMAAEAYEGTLTDLYLPRK